MLRRGARKVRNGIELGPQNLELGAVGETLDSLDSFEGSDFLPNISPDGSNRYATWLVLTILPPGCDRIVDGPCTKGREGIGSGVAVENLFSQHIDCIATTDLASS